MALILATAGYMQSVQAAEVWLGPMDVPVMKYVYVCWMATWGASAAFLQKYASGDIDKTWKNVGIHMLKDAVNSNLAAIIAFMACQHYGVPKAIEAICYTLAGYGGARSMEAMYKKFISTGSAAIDKATGLPGSPPAVDTPPPPGA